MKILHVFANPKPTEESASKQLAAAFFGKLFEMNPDLELENVDLYEDQPPFLTYETYCAAWYPVMIEGYTTTDKDEEALVYAKKHAEIFNSADVLVITTPMWNFSTPGILKAWLDQILTPGQTFDLVDGKAKPLHKIRKVVLLVASGGTYKEGDPKDTLSTAIENALSYIDIDDVSLAWADGQNTIAFTDYAQRKEFAIEAAQELAEEVAEIEVPY